jgi:hypothetical protein
VDFGDQRLNRRFLKTAHSLSQHPERTINRACENWAQTKAAYRLFDNEKVEAEEILRPHREKTFQRMQGMPVVLALSDTSYFSYQNHPQTQGLGGIGKHGNAKDQSQGLMVHTAFAVDPQSSDGGTPLGILHQQFASRDAEDTVKNKSMSRREKYMKPIEDKEAWKWFEVLHAMSGQKKAIQQRIVYVSDRESDSFEYLVEAQRLGHEVLIRANQDRSIEIFGIERNWKKRTLWHFLSEQPVSANFQLKVPSISATRKRAKREEREAQVEVRHCRVPLEPSSSVKRKHRERAQRLNAATEPGQPEITELLESVWMDVIWVKEINAPEGVEPLEWMLLTNNAVIDLRDLMERIRWYRMRWHIESFHRVFKSGCAAELCRLETAERLTRYLSLISIIAWRLYWMSRVSRAKPDASAELLLTQHEWQALYCKVHKTQNPPSNPPRLRQAVHWIAGLGGFLGRKGDGEPGPTTIWRGWQRLTDVAEDWLIFHPSQPQTSTTERCG